MEAYEFDDFRVDVAQCALTQAGLPVALTPKAFDTLRLLVENRGRLLDKEMMMQRLWPDAVVEEANLANNISSLRKALGKSADRIQTVPRRGYRFTGDVRVISDTSPAPPPHVVAGVPARRLLLPLAAIALIALGFAIAWLLKTKSQPPVFTQLTFRRGMAWGARFTGDGNTVVYAGAHEGKPAELFITRGDQAGSKPLDVHAAALLSVSKRGELAILTKATLAGFFPIGTLARMPLTGGAPRELADDVQEADWSPDGNALAVIHWDGSIVRVEYPMGRVLFQAAEPKWVSALRVSPDGSEVAFLLHESQRFDDRGCAVIVDKSGRITTRSREFVSANGLAWANGGKEIWISASAADLNNSIYAVDRRGRDHVIGNSAGRLILFDVAANGAALAGLEDDRIGIIVGSPSGSEHELSWLDGSWLRDVSADGSTILFDEESIGGGPTAHVYVRKVDGSPAADLGEGHAVALSPDGKWVLARQRFTNPPRFMIIPTGAGQARPLRTGNVAPLERASWLPDGKRLVFVGNEPGRKPRTFLIDLDGDRVHPITAEGITGACVTADGAYVAARRSGQPLQLFPIAGGEPHSINGVTPADVAIRLTSDGRALYTATMATRTLNRIELASGQRSVVASYGAARPAETVYTTPAHVSDDGRVYAYTYASFANELFIVHGLR